jgi:ribosome-associated translation inhibitor RaiA
MQIQVNTDSNIDGTAELDAHVKSAIESRLDRFRDDVTRVEVHLADESAGRSTTADKRCMLEARLAWRSPVTVTCHSATVEEALTAAIGKLVTVLGRESGRRGNRKGAASIRTDSPPPETPADRDTQSDTDPRDRADRDAT